jgi:serine/threonine-protein kinase
MSITGDLKSIFGKAMDLPSPARAAYLDEACGGNPSLREEVESLLQALQDASRFLQDRSPTVVATALEPLSDRAGMAIGAYKLLEQIGEGGFGIVFLAEQTQPVRRKVALKVLKPGMDTRQVVARFEAERQALALMDHPNLAHIFEGGETATGRPYFVMELVRGVPITDFCDQNQLPVRERLELFLPVCQAVQHAHHKGVIHRDLKPSNVLVTRHEDRAVVKVIDFGIAKALGQQLTDKTVFTNLAQMIGTPLYMSPEQAQMSGLDVDTRSDVYSLGVLLYELLTGTTPFDKERLQQAGYDEMRRIIREEEPPRPSTRLSTLAQAATNVSMRHQGDPRQLSQLLRGELDWIVMKALEKDRNRRYESSGAFAADVERYLKDEPVHACPPSAWYRLGKFARRNKTALATAALVLFVLVALGIGAGWVVRDREAQEQERLRDRAAREAALDEETRRAVNEAASLIPEGKWPEALTVIQRIEKLLVTAGRQPDDFPEALPELDKDVRMAQRLEAIHSQPGRQELPNVKHLGVTGAQFLPEYDTRPMTEEIFGGQEVAAAYARAFRDYGIDLAVLPTAEAAQRIRGRSIRLELARALDFWSSMRRHAGNQGPPDWKLLLAVARLADPDPWRNRLREARESGDRKGLETLAATADFRRLPPGTLHLLGSALNEVGSPEQAAQVLRQAQRQYPGDLWINNALGWICYSSLRPPQYDEAVRFYTAAVAVRPRNPYGIRALGMVWHAKGSYREAIAEFTRAIELKPNYREAWWDRAFAYVSLEQWDKAMADYTRVTELDPKALQGWNGRGFVYAEMSQWDRAISEFTRALELNPRAVIALYNRGCCYGRLGKWNQAIADYTKTIELAPQHLKALLGRGQSYSMLKQWDQAIADYSKGIELQPKEKLLWAYRGVAYLTLRQWDKAIADFTKALELDPKHAKPWAYRGEAYLGLRQWEKAIADFTKALELEPRLTLAWNNRGSAYSALKQVDRAIADFSRAIELSPKIAQFHYNLGSMLALKYQWDQAIAAYRRAIDLQPTFAEAHNGLGHALRAQGQFSASLDCFKRGHALGSKRKDWHSPSAQWLEEAEQLVCLEAKLADVLSGKAAPADNQERLGMLAVCMFQRRYAAASRLYGEAFAEDPKLADDLTTGRRYIAASAAARAAAGQGTDADQLDPKDRIRLRKQALAWLRDDLNLWSKRLGGGKVEDCQVVRNTLQHWQRDPDLIGIREVASLKKLADDEQAACRKLWADVAELLEKAKAK